MNKELAGIVKTEMRPMFGLHHWYLFGLNIFSYNDVESPIEQRPDVQFLTDITRRYNCSAHVSSLALKDLVEAPEEIFGPSTGDTPYLCTRIDFYEIFYDLEAFACSDACFFPNVTPLFWNALLRGENDLEQILLNNGLAFYVDLIPGSLEEFKKHLTSPFPGESEWLNVMTNLCRLVLTVGHDGQYFEVYSRDEDCLRLIQPSLRVACASVTESVWYQDHKRQLAWSTELDECLMLPKR